MKIQKMLAVCLAALLLLGQIVTFSTFAEPEEPQEHLVVHYDFLGDTLEEKLRDKAPKGTADHLTFGNAGSLSKIENGVAYIHEAAGNYLNVPQVSSDITAATQLTFVTRFKFEGDTPGNLVDMVMLQNNVLRWSIIANGTLSATFFPGSTYACGLGGGTVYTAGQWIDMALTVSYDAATGTVTASRYVSVDGWKNYVPTSVTKQNCSSNPFAGTTGMILGKNNTGIGDRGRSVAFQDFRIYDTVLTVEQIRGIVPQEAPDTADFSHLEQYLITHYDFLGETLPEQLRDKGTGGRVAENLTLATTQTNGVDDSYIKNGVAYVNRKAQNYLRAANIGDIKNIQQSITVFLEFKAYIEQPINVGDVLVIGNTSRIGYFYNTANPSVRYLYAAAGKNNSGAGPTSPATANLTPEGFENGWIRAAYTLEYDADAGKATITLRYSFDGGATWAEVSRTAIQSDQVDLTTIFGGATELLLGKVATGIADRGVSFCYNDIRVYNKALTEEEVQSISPESYRNYRDTLAVHYDFIGSTQEECLTDKVSGAKLTLGTTEENGIALSYASNGLAHIDRASGNYLFLEHLPQVTGADGSMTVFAAFRPEGTAVGKQINDILSISDTVRLGFWDSTLRPHVRLGEGLTSAHQHSADAQGNVAGQWIRLAAVLHDDGNGNLSCITYLSFNEGATWVTYAGYAVSGVSMDADNASMILGKYTSAYPDYGLSYTFSDVRIYSSALTVDELKTVCVYESPDLTGVDMEPTEDLSLNFYLPVSVADQYDSVIAVANCLDRSVELEPVGTVTRNGVDYLCFRYREVTALLLNEPVTVTVSAVRDGKVWHGAPTSYDVAEYCYQTIRSENASAGLKRLCVDILVYGTKAQLYFAYRTDALADRFLTDAERSLASAVTPEAISVCNPAFGGALNENAVLAVFKSVSVNLKNPLQLCFKLALSIPVQDELTVVLTDKEGTLLQTVSLTQAAESNGIYSVAYSAADPKSAVLATVWKNYGESNATAVSNTLCYSLESYAASKQNSANQALVELVGAMLRYWDSVAALRN